MERDNLGACELLSEVERVLLLSLGGISLLEHLSQDEQLREGMVSLLSDFATQAKGTE